MCSWQCLDVLPRLATADEGEVLLCRRAQRLNDQLQLVNVVLPRKQRFPLKELCQYAPHRPACIALGRQAAWAC